MGDTLVFKTHAPKSAHHAIHVNCVLIGLHLRLVQPDRAGYGNGSIMSENGYKNLSKSLRDYIAFAFAVLIWHHECIDWTTGKWFLSVFLKFKGRGKLIKLLEVKCETERTPVQVRYWRQASDRDERRWAGRGVDWSSYRLSHATALSCLGKRP